MDSGWMALLGQGMTQELWSLGKPTKSNQMCHVRSVCEKLYLDCRYESLNILHKGSQGWLEDTNPWTLVVTCL